MKKYILSAVVILGFLFYSASNKSAGATLNTYSNGNSKTIPPPNAGGSTTGKSFKDGTYNGDVSNAFYGNIQVAAVVKGGKLTAVNVLQYPNDRGRSIAVNQQALPMLQSEAITAQSGTVDIISGATDTSQAFINSLTTALTQASN